MSEHQTETKSGLSMSSFLKASHRLRDLSCVNSGYLFSRSGSLFLDSNKRNLLMYDCFFGMKFDSKVNKFVIEIKGLSAFCHQSQHNEDLVGNQSSERSIKRP